MGVGAGVGGGAGNGGLMMIVTMRQARIAVPSMSKTAGPLIPMAAMTASAAPALTPLPPREPSAKRRA